MIDYVSSNGTRYEIPGDSVQRGPGKAQNGNDIVYFIVIDRPEAQEFRRSYGLPPRDFHTTMVFNNKDIHGVPKNKTLKEDK